MVQSHSNFFPIFVGVLISLLVDVYYICVMLQSLTTVVMNEITVVEYIYDLFIY